MSAILDFVYISTWDLHGMNMCPSISIYLTYVILEFIDCIYFLKKRRHSTKEAFIMFFKSVILSVLVYGDAISAATKLTVLYRSRVCIGHTPEISKEELCNKCNNERLDKRQMF